MEYFNELHHIDVSTKYADMMRGFVQHPDLPKLFCRLLAALLRLAIAGSYFPEGQRKLLSHHLLRIVQGRYLSTWFTWNLERSYPQGRSDLEFVGKFNEQYAGMRIVIEFKYYSNTEFKQFKTPIEDFQLQDEDTEQIAGYVEGLRQEYPEARISQYVIYCFGNQGFRVFAVGG